MRLYYDRIKGIFVRCLLIIIAVYSFQETAFTVEAAEIISEESIMGSSMPDKTDGKVVKVGFFSDKPSLMKCNEDGSGKSGYGYDYLQMIANYTGWKYEYVEGTWNELWDKLVAGEIDFLESVSYTAEREEQVIFPDYSMGKETYRLYTYDASTDISASNVNEVLNGKKVGITAHTLQYDLFSKWIKARNIECQIIGYEVDEEKSKDLKSGSIDAVVESELVALEGWEPIIEVGSSDYYLVASKVNEELVRELNKALDSIQAVDPNYFDNLYYTYYANKIVSSKLTADELKWVNSHNQIVCGYMQSNITSVYNAYAEVIEEIIKVVSGDNNLEVKLVKFDTYMDMVNSLQVGKIDVAFPLYDNNYQAERGNYSIVNDFLPIAVNYIKRDDASNDRKKIVVKDVGIMKLYTENSFPEAQVIEAESAEDCFDMVADGEADLAVLSELEVENYFGGKSAYTDLQAVKLFNPVNVGFGVRKDDSGLFMLLKRGIALIDLDFINSSIANHSFVTTEYTVFDFLKEYFAIIFFLFLIFCLVIGALIITKKQRAMDAVYQSKLEEEKRKAETASAAKTTFLFNMSHDIRTPMNAIIGYSNMLDKYKDDDEKFNDYLNNIKASGHHLLDLINDVLEMAHIESGKMELVDDELCNITEFYEDMAIVFGEDVRKKNLTYIQNINVKNNNIYCDSTKLRKIVMNLLSNAVKYTPEGGSISLSVEEIECDKDGYAGYCTVVSDTGIGMSKEFLPHIFEIFERERNATESKIMGTGLGMGITKKLVELMQGNIQIESELGKGTVVTIVLLHRIADSCEYDDKTKEEYIVREGLFEGKRILLAEDNALNAEIAEEILGVYGIEVERAVDGVECIRMMDEAPAGYYDLIMMDIQMPNINGYKATLAIRRMDDKVKCTIPIIAMTANVFDIDQQNAREVGMNDFLGKPMNIQDLEKILAIWLCTSKES